MGDQRNTEHPSNVSRCPSRSRGGIVCVLPNGHEGEHEYYVEAMYEERMPFNSEGWPEYGHLIDEGEIPLDMFQILMVIRPDGRRAYHVGHWGEASTWELVGVLQEISKDLMSENEDDDG